MTLYFSPSSSTVMKMSVCGLMTITAVMRNLSARSTSGSGLNMKFCFLNQGCRSKNMVLKSFTMINNKDDIVSHSDLNLSVLGLEVIPTPRVLA